MPKIMNIVVIDGKEVLIETLPDEKRKRLKDTANQIATTYKHRKSQ